MKVGIIMGSASDAPILEHARSTLKEFGIESEFRALSAHRSPAAVIEWTTGAEERGIKVIIASAGLAAHLAGVVAAHTTLPVLGVPVDGGGMGGLDSLLSTVQMPKGTPVGTLAVGKSGAINAAILAARIIAVGDADMAKKVAQHKVDLTAAVLEADAKLGG